MNRFEIGTHDLLSKMSLLAAALLVATAAVGVTGCGSEGGDGAGTKGGEEATKAGDDTAEAGDDDDTATDDDDGDSDSEALDFDAVAAAIGVEPGAFEPDPEVGPEAVVTAREGAVEARRAGEEEFVAVTEDGHELYPGDQVRTVSGRAVVTMVDESVVELAEDTTIAVGDRDATADPASSAAVLYGVARFSVAERGAGEGPFLVFTASGIVGTRGTTYAVGVSVTGQVRVGVEEGEVEIAGAGSLDAPVVLAAGKSVELTFDGRVEKPEPFDEDDWGDWRDGEEADADPKELAELHTGYLEEAYPEMDEAYAEMETVSADATVMIDDASGYEEAGDTPAYEASVEDRAAAIEASYLATLRLQYLTYALAGRAYIAHELYVRHPKEVAPVYVVAAPRIHAAVLYPKKLTGVVYHHVRPMRPYYYEHHPVGRAHAVAVKHPVRPFYAAVKLKPLPPGLAKKRVKRVVYYPPRVTRPTAKKVVYVTHPRPGWGAKVAVKPRPYRKKAWYVTPSAPRAKTMVGVKAVGPRTVHYKVTAPRVTRKAAMVDFGPRRATAVGVKVKGPHGATATGVKVVGPRGPTATGVKVVGPHGPTATGVKVGGPRGATATGVKVVGPHGPTATGVKVGGPRGATATGVKVGGPRGPTATGVKVKGPAGAGMVGVHKTGPVGGSTTRVKKVGPAGGSVVGVKKTGPGGKSVTATKKTGPGGRSVTTLKGPKGGKKVLVSPRKK